MDAQVHVSPSQGYVESTVAALAPLADATRAPSMRSYMKDVAPFLGVASPDRRAAQRAAWRGLPLLVESDLASACEVLWNLPEREYQYAACDLVARHTALLGPDFVAGTTQTLLTTKPWWDTVDGLGTAVVSPVVARNPSLVDLMWQWLDSGDRWLIRAAIQHQRGLKERTDVTRLLTMCDRFAADRDFFVAKAIGWALRDVTAWDAGAVREFVADHPDLSAVARREATRGLARSVRP